MKYALLVLGMLALLPTLIQLRRGERKMPSIDDGRFIASTARQAPE